MSNLKKLLWWLPALLWMGVIFYMSSKTGPGGPEWMSVVGHIVEYSVLAGLLFFALYQTADINTSQIMLAAILFATAYGISDEWHQSFVATRVPDIMDVLTDFGAASAASIIAGTISTAHKKRRHR